MVTIPNNILVHCPDIHPPAKLRQVHVDSDHQSWKEVTKEVI